jgi:phosphonate transport system permease protein
MSQNTIDEKLQAILSGRFKYKAIRYTFYLIAFLLILWSIQSTVIDDTDWDRIGGFGSVARGVGKFFPPDLSLFKHLVGPTIETFMIACLGTLFAVILSIPVAWMAALNVTPSKAIAYPIGRAIMTLTRSVHEIVWGLIFVSAVGLGALPGIMAVSMRSIGFIAKLTAEAIEDIDPGPLEAIKSTGANGFQVMMFGVIPQVLPVFVGNTVFQWDINIRRATIMGLVGAGGLGLAFHRQLVMYNYGGVTTVIIAILLLIAIGEVGSYYGRKAIR